MSDDPFTIGLGAATVAPVLIAVDAAVRACLDLTDDDILGSELADFRIQNLTTATYFLLETEAAATQFVLDLLTHAKVVIDLARSEPNRKWISKAKSRPRVVWSADAPFLAEIGLVFGELRATTVWDSGTFPHQLIQLEDPTAKASALSLLRRMVRIEIDVDLERLVDPTDLVTDLPPQLDKWLPSSMASNPYLFIWNAFEWDSCLNLPLANTDADIDPEALGLSEAQSEVLAAYTTEESLKMTTAINHSVERFMAFRRSLIRKAYVDLLNPWRNFQLNLAKKLRPILSYEQRFDPSQDSLCKAFTLSRETMGDAEARLSQALREKSGGRGIAA